MVKNIISKNANMVHQLMMPVALLLAICLTSNSLLAEEASDAQKNAVNASEKATVNEVGSTAEDKIKAEANQNKVVEKVAVEPAVEAEEKVLTFDIFEFQVEGNTKLDNAQIESAVYQSMGENKTIDDVDKARESLEKAYHAAGYLTVLVDIPEQEVNTKVVRLHVTEGKVSQLRVSGSKYYSLGRIKSVSSTVNEGEVPHFPTLQKQITQLNRTADRRVTPVIKAGRVFGTVDVDLKVEDTLPLHASLELNDQFSRDTTRYRLGGSIKYDNLFQRDHSFGLSFLTSPQDFDEAKVLSGNYLMRFDDSDLLLAAYAIWSKSNIATIGGTNVLGDAKILGARLIKPLPALDNYFHSLSFGVDYKDFGQSLVFGEDDNQQPVSYMPLSFSYSGTLQSEAAKTQINASSVLGVRGLFANDAEFANRRPGELNKGKPINPAKPNFFVAKLELENTQLLPKDFEFYGKVDGQFTGAKLIATEQILAGGANSVRGYMESDAQGDRGYHTTLELRSPRLFSKIAWIKELKAKVFYDAAKLFTIEPIDGEAEESFISGTGFGFQLKTIANINGTLDFAWVLDDYLTMQSGDFRTHMRLWYEF